MGDNSPLFEDIDRSAPASFPLDSANVRTEYLSLAKLYGQAVNKFTETGTHEHGFFNYCAGNVAVFYLRQLLQIKPNLDGVVALKMNNETSYDSRGRGKGMKVIQQQQNSYLRGLSQSVKSISQTKKPRVERETTQVQQPVVAASGYMTELNNITSYIAYLQSKRNFCEGEEK